MLRAWGGHTPVLTPKISTAIIHQNGASSAPRSPPIPTPCARHWVVTNLDPSNLYNLVCGLTMQEFSIFAQAKMEQVSRVYTSYDLFVTTRYITRAISLGVRLAANISAGHLLLAILSKFAQDAILTNNLILRLIPITALSLIRLLEIMVALIQAYVFTLLTTIYISDTIKL